MIRALLATLALALGPVLAFLPQPGQAAGWERTPVRDPERGRELEFAPTRIEFATALRERLAAPATDAPLAVRGEPLLDPALLRDFYAERGYAPLWAHAHGASHQPDVAELLQALESARAHGLDPDTYHADALATLRRDPAAAPDLELLATDAFLRQALHRAHGLLTPTDVDPEWHLLANEVEPRAVLAQLAEGLPPAFALDDLWPRAPDYWALLDEKRRLRARGAAPPATVSAGPLLRLHDVGTRVLELRARLGVAPLDDPCFDAGLDAAVRALQQEQGLAVDGVVGPNTLQLLNMTDAERIRHIDVNLERWRWLMRVLPDTRIQVNVAEFELDVVESGQQVLSMGVIVGTPFRRTPVFSEPMRYLVLNPYWNVPRRIAVEDKLPLLQKDPAALAAMGYEARFAQADAPVLPVDAIDWSAMTRSDFNYLLRQRPGPDNALGRIKFILPNPYAVYLHDTPARELFARSHRAFSSGCIRLEHAMQLADWVLRNQPEWTRTRLDEVLAAGEPVDVPLRQTVPVLVLYLTVTTDGSGRVFYRPDLYGRDEPVAAALAALQPRERL